MRTENLKADRLSEEEKSMEGYDAKDAGRAITEQIMESGAFEMEKNRIAAIVQTAIELDLVYIERSGALDKGTYDEDDAFEFIVDGVIVKLGADEAEELDIAALVEAYMDYNDAYMEEHDLIDWE